MNRRFLSWAVYALLALWPSAAFAVNANPVPGSIWTYFGPTLGADWASSTVFNLGGPPWTTSYGNFDAFRVSVNNYPPSGEYVGAPTFNIPTAVTGAINVPSNAVSTPLGAGFGVQGLSLSASPNVGAVGLFGFGGQTADHVLSWGINTVGTNCPTPACQPNTGFGGSGSTIWGAEIDVNVFKEAGAAPLNLAVRGIELVGASETQVGAGGSSFGISVRPLGANPPIIPWQTAFVSADGAAINGLALGATAMPPATADSQAFCMDAYNGNSTNLASCIINAHNGVLQLNGATQVSLQVQGVHIVDMAYAAGASTVNLIAPSTAPLTPSPALTLGGYDINSTHLFGVIQLVTASTQGSMVYNAPSGSHIFETNGGIEMGLFPVGGAGSTSMQLNVNNNAGANVANVILGAPNSGGTGFRALVVPN